MRKDEYVIPECEVIIIKMEAGIATSPELGGNESTTGDDY